MIRFLSTTATAVAIAVLVSVGWGGPSFAAETPGFGGDPSRAVFEGEIFDLAEGWGAAAACAELGVVVECFRSETELLRAHPELDGDDASHVTSEAATASVAASSCSSSLRLYRLTGHSGGALYLSTRLVGHNLSAYGFDNDTSSYTVGACSSAFYSGANLGGSQYPGSTAAFASATSMVSGWNNVVSSVMIF